MAPIIICILLPLWQIGNLVYAYDIAIIVSILSLRFPRRGTSKAIVLPLSLIAVGVVMSTLASFVWVGLSLRAMQQGLQIALAVGYALSLFSNIVTARVSMPIMAIYVSMSALALAMILVLQAVGYQLAPSLTADIQRSYLEFSGYTTSFFDNRYLSGIASGSVVRVTGTWDVQTTAGGMLALASLWIAYTAKGPTFKFVLLGAIFVGLVATGSRHSWVLWSISAYIVIGSTHYIRIRTTIFAFGLAFSSLFLIALALLPGENLVAAMLGERLNRTISSGLSDSSFQLRYVEGTVRFIKGILINPLIAIFGFGIATEKEIWTNLGPVRFAQLAAENSQWAFVSNSWLLLIRNFGITAFAGVCSLVLQLSNRKLNGSIALALFFALIFLADNYAAQVPRSFMLIIATMTSFLAILGSPSQNPALVRSSLIGRRHCA